MKKIIFILFAVVSWQHALAQTFTYNGLNFTVTSPTTAEVAYQIGATTGTISIPAQVTNDSSVYSVNKIGVDAFAGCYGLTSVTIPNTVTSIGDFAFSGCNGLTSISIPDSVTIIGYLTFFSCSSLTSITIPNSVTSIGEQAFRDCSGLTSITIPNSVALIEFGTFAFCSGLTSVTIGNSITSIGNYAFYDCSSLNSVIIPSLVTSIGENAFESCSGISSVTIPSSVTSIGNFAFRFCASLTSLTCNVATPLSINTNVFIGVNQSACSLTVPYGSVAAYQAAAVWQDFAPVNPDCFSLTESTTTISVCDSYTWINTSQTYTESGIYTGSTTNCVSEVLNLTIIPSSTNATTISACDSYTWANTRQTYTTSGTYRGTTTNCITEVLELTINTIPSVPSLSLLDQYCDVVTGYLGLKNQAQTFTAGASGNLDKISLYLGNPNGDASESDVTVQVYEGSGTTETLLESQTYTYPAQWGFQNIDFNFSTIAVVQGQHYTFKLSTPTVSQGFLGINTDNTYSGGSLDFAPSSDMIFKTYVNRSNQTFCQGATVANLNVDGTNTNWYNAATGGNQLSSTTLLETGTYFASQIGNSCESERVAVNVLVNPTSAFTSQPVANFICSTVGSTATFSVESSAVSPTYTWQYRVATTANSNPEWITITTANAAVYANFNTATLTVTKTATLPATGTQYRVLVSGTCGSATSDVAALTILSTVKAGTVTSAASVCIGSDITLTLGASAGSSFQWQSAATATGVFANIAGATGTTYTITGATATMDKSYRVVVTNSCNTTTATTAIKTLKVDPTSVAGTVTGGGTICSGSTGTLKVAGYVGTIQWQSSGDGIDFVNVPSIVGTAGVNYTSGSVTGIAATYIATNITEATYFRAKITSGACSVAYSNAVQFTMGTASSAGTLTAAVATVCSGTGTTLTLAGSVGTIKWFKSTNWTAASPTWTPVTTSTSGTLATGNLTLATAYKAEVSIGSCSTATSQVVPVLVYAAPLAKTITANVTSPTGTTALLAICSSTSKVLTIGSGYNGTIQWQKSTTSTTTGFADIAGENATTYTVTNPSIGVNYFRAKFTNSCGVSVFGTAFIVYYKDCTIAKTMVTSNIKNSEFEVIAYPNPYTENFNLSLTTSSVDTVTISVYDMIGKLIDRREISPSEVPGIQVGANYPSGVYNVIVTQGENMKTVRVVKR